MISTRNLRLLPAINDLRRLMQSMAMLDAILCPERNLRYFCFDAAWAPGEMLGSMNNGQGDDWFAHFTPAGCWFKGFAHESLMSPYADDPPRVWPGVLDSVPVEFAQSMNEPAFSVREVTYCLWRRSADTAWRTGPVELPVDGDADGSEGHLSMLDGRPESYRDWAEEYYEQSVEFAAVAHVHRHAPLSAAVVRALNPHLSMADVQREIDEIGYGAP